MGLAIGAGGQLQEHCAGPSFGEALSEPRERVLEARTDPRGVQLVPLPSSSLLCPVQNDNHHRNLEKNSDKHKN